MEQPDRIFPYRWSVGLGIDEPVRAVTVFTKNRQRLPACEVAEGFFTGALAQARRASCLASILPCTVR